MNDVERWLQDLGLGGHAPAFAEQSIEFDLLPELNDDDLKGLGVAALGHRKRLLRAIAALRADAPVRLAPGPAQREPEPASPPHDVGRRQLTVMFCDLVGSTALSARLDPEDLQALLSDFHRTVASAVAPFEGHVAQLLGDGILVYFGFPKAHEDDAERAVWSALGVLAALQASPRPSGRALQTRIGIATGTVAVGEVGTGTAAAEISASGEAPNLAARLQALAQPGEILLADDTRRLVGETFSLQARGPLALKGFSRPVRAWRVLGELRRATRFESRHLQDMVELVGRQSEIALLLDRWALACEREGQVVLLSGEAGIGKSRLCQTLRGRLAAVPAATVTLQCSPHFSRRALYPVVQTLEAAAGIVPADPPAARARRLEQLAGPLAAVSVGCLLRLAGLPDGGRGLPGDASPQAEGAHTLEAILQLLNGWLARGPTLLLVEDAHWIDPSTEALLGQIVQCIRDAPALMLVTCRPGFSPAWGNAAHLTRHSLNRLSQKQCAALVTAVTRGRVLPAEVLAEIVRRADGIPLFVEELTKTVLGSGLLLDTPAGLRLTGPLPALAIPATLQDSLMARLDGLALAKQVAQAGAVIGREFGRRLLSQVLGELPPAQLDSALADLERSELVFCHGAGAGASFRFKHALVRDAAYQSMLKHQRMLCHRQIAAALEGGGDAAAVQPELLAHHHQEAGDAAAALHHWQVAGDQAIARSAAREAAAHYQAAAALVALVQASKARDERELGLHIRLGNALVQSEGFTSAHAMDSYGRAGELAGALDLPDEQVQAYCGVAAGLNAAGRFDEAMALLERPTPAQLARLKPMTRAARRMRMGYLHLLRGELSDAAGHLGEARLALDQVLPGQWHAVAGVDPLVAILIWQGQGLMMRCRPAAAQACLQEGLAIAEQRQHSSSRAWVLYNMSLMCGTRSERSHAVALCTQALDLSRRFGLTARIAQATFGLGRALVVAGDPTQGLRLLRDGYAAWTAFGGRFGSTLMAAAAAEALLDAGLRDEALDFTLAGEATQRETDEKYAAAPLLSLRARFAVLDGASAQAEAACQQAIGIAAQQGALLYALRAATALARLHQEAGRSAAACAALRPVHARVVEGFDCPDVVDARTWLDACEAARRQAAGRG